MTLASRRLPLPLLLLPLLLLVLLLLQLLLLPLLLPVLLLRAGAPLPNLIAFRGGACQVLRSAS